MQLQITIGAAQEMEVILDPIAETPDKAIPTDPIVAPQNGTQPAATPNDRVRLQAVWVLTDQGFRIEWTEMKETSQVELQMT